MPLMQQRTRETVARGSHPAGYLLQTLMCAALAQVVAGCARDSHTSPTDPGPESAKATHPVLIRRPHGAPTVATGAFDEHGKPITVSCATCHATRTPETGAKLGSPLTSFHQKLVGNHGQLSCNACHNPADGYTSLRLAQGTSVPFSEVITLCAQCHGPQYRDFQHGAHGGMNGYWDLSRGSRVRNTCIDCHDSHAPKYPTVAPARGPHDRFQTGGSHE